MTLPAILPALVMIGVPGPAATGPAPGRAIPAIMLASADQTTPPGGTAPATSGQLAPTPAPDLAADIPASDQAPAAPQRDARGDPLEGFNRAMFSVHQKVDKAVFRPAALGYRHVVPKPVRSGLRNFFSNLGEPIIALNFLLQLKVGKAGETLGRFAINSTIGIGGVIDIAKGPDFKLPHRSNGFGNTLAFYGVGPGPYLFLPLVGPTDLRDFLGGESEGLVLPLAVGNPFDRIEYQLPRGIITGLDQRAEADDDLRALMDGAVDPYATLRSAYLQSRQGEIDQLRGKPSSVAAPELGEPLDDPAGTMAAPVPGSTAAPELSDPLADPAAKPPVTSPAPSASPDTTDPLTDPAAAPVKR